MLELRHLKTLHALREADSLVEAAERLHLTQSALQRAAAKEERLHNKAARKMKARMKKTQNAKPQWSAILIKFRPARCHSSVTV